MQELDSSQNNTEFQLKSPNWAGGDSRGPESAIHASTGYTGVRGARCSTSSISMRLSSHRTTVVGGGRGARRAGGVYAYRAR
jgi:hypothetical protein